MLRIHKATGTAIFAILIVLYFISSGSIHPTSLRIPYLTSQTLKPSLVGPPILLYPQAERQTYARAIKLRSGALLASLTVYDPENSLALAISHDQGLSWQPHGTVISKPASEATPLDNAFLLELPSGRLLCAFRAHTMKPEALGAEEKPGGQNEGYLFFRLMIYRSDDGGKNWEYLSTPTEEAGPEHGNWEPFLRLSSYGELQFYYSREMGGGRDQDNLMRVSHDEGVTWSAANTVSGLDLVTRDGMMGITEVVPGSGHLMAVFETVEETGDGTSFEARFEIWSVTSRDDGKTWGERRMMNDAWHGVVGDPHRLSMFFPSNLSFLPISSNSFYHLSTLIQLSYQRSNIFR